MTAPVPHLKHIINVQPVPLSAAQRANARRILYQLVETFEAADNVRGARVSFVYPRLVRYTYEYSLSDDSRDVFLRAFLDMMELGLDGATVLDMESMKPRFAAFAACLLDNFFCHDASRQAALAILNMFDLGVAHTINGVDIDRPRNALTLSATFHHLCGSFRVYFEPVPGAYNTYWVRSFLPPPINSSLGLPVQRTLFVTDTHTIEPPSKRLLAIHRAIAHVLQLSAAARYIDDILRDLEYNIVRADGSSELGRMVSLVLGYGSASTASG